MWLLVAAGMLSVELHGGRPTGDDRWQVDLGVTAVEVDGTVMDAGGEWTVLAGGRPVPVVDRRTWAAAGGDLIIVLLLKRIPELAPLHLVAAEPLAEMARLAGARMSVEGVGDELLAGVDAAVAQVTAESPEPGRPLRRLVIVVADGLDADPRAERYTDVARRAGAAGVRIHTLGWHPRGDRRPMLGLAELSARSHGTFRMVTGARDALTASVAAHVQQLLVELRDQPLLTVELPAAALGAPLTVRYAGLESRNQVSFAPPAAAGDRRLRWWWIAVPVALLATGAGGFIVVRRRRKAAA